MKILLLDIAGLGYDLWKKYAKSPCWDELNSKSIKTVFPALTCPVQCTMRTALPPEQHTMVLNGKYHYELTKPLFWEQSSSLFKGERIWEQFRQKGKKVGQIFVQQSMGRDADLMLTPQPIHKHHGGMIQDCYTQPTGLYPLLCEELGFKFSLFDYWGPLAKSRSSLWISKAAINIMESPVRAPDLFFVYIPHLDYCQQKYGPNSKQTQEAFECLEEEVLEPLFESAKKSDYQIILFGDYAITEAKQAIYPNRILRENNLFNIRMIQKMVYPDFWSSDAFAVVDHQVAHIVVNNSMREDEIRTIFEKTQGVRRVIKSNCHEHHACDWLIEADPGYWFAYPWWDPKETPPEYATHMDIHNKPGFDPCELFMEMWPPFSISMNTSKVKGTHGNAFLPAHDVFYGSTFNIGEVDSVLSLSEQLKTFLNSQS